MALAELPGVDLVVGDTLAAGVLGVWRGDADDDDVVVGGGEIGARAWASDEAVGLVRRETVAEEGVVAKPDLFDWEALDGAEAGPFTLKGVVVTAPLVDVSRGPFVGVSRLASFAMAKDERDRPALVWECWDVVRMGGLRPSSGFVGERALACVDLGVVLVAMEVAGRRGVPAETDDRRLEVAAASFVPGCELPVEDLALLAAVDCIRRDDEGLGPEVCLARAAAVLDVVAAGLPTDDSRSGFGEITLRAAEDDRDLASGPPSAVLVLALTGCIRPDGSSGFSGVLGTALPADPPEVEETFLVRSEPGVGGFTSPCLSSDETCSRCAFVGLGLTRSC